MSPREISASNRFWLHLGGAFFAVLLIIVWEHVQARSFDRQLKQMRLEADRLTYENGRLETQIHQWISPSHLDQVAKQQLGMTPPDPKHIVGLHNP